MVEQTASFSRESFKNSPFLTFGIERSVPRSAAATAVRDEEEVNMLVSTSPTLSPTLTSETG